MFIYGIVSDMLADASHLIDFGSFPKAECLAIKLPMKIV
jgi:hypothetical protein